MVDGLVDTGADISILRNKEAELWGLHVIPWSGEAMVAVDNESSPLGEAIVEVKIANTLVRLRVAVVNDLVYPFLLGSDWRTSANLGILVWPDGHVTLQPPGRSNNQAPISMFLVKEPVTHIAGALPSLADEAQTIQDMVFFNSTSTPTTDIFSPWKKVLSDDSAGPVKEQPRETSHDNAPAPLPPSQFSPRKCPFPLFPGTSIVVPQENITPLPATCKAKPSRSNPTSSSPTTPNIASDSFKVNEYNSECAYADELHSTHPKACQTTNHSVSANNAHNNVDSSDLLLVNTINVSDLIPLDQIIVREANEKSEIPHSDILTYLENLQDKVTSDINDTQLTKLQDIILKHTNVFSKQKYDIRFLSQNRALYRPI
ncbi:uncharacterized protein LOC135388413 isoform X1 [Ornithodoros turicata]|uniref:uncharacterized protein LOC135388413 isoform X1 n=1 Tax=Ornithodoros turicata TaxID=34597 RepID=UPI003139B889